MIERWLANKTPEHVRAWIIASASHVFVACREETILAVGAVTSTGHVTLNYVAPEYRFRGVSKAILAHLEVEAKKLGAKSCTLNSTETARSFYRAAGYVEKSSPARGRQGIAGYLMSKHL